MSEERIEPSRVLHVITRLIVGGAQENTMYTAALLNKERFQVDVISGSQTGSEGSLIEEVRERGVKLTILPELVREISPLNDVKALLSLRKLIKRGRYAIVHTHSSKAGILGRLAAWSAGTTIIVHTIHGWSFHDYMPRSTQAIYIFLERWIAKICDRLIVVSEQDIEKGLRNGIGEWEQYLLVRSAIPLDEFKPDGLSRGEVRTDLGIPEQAVVVGNIGRFSSQKNPLEWVQVAGRVGRELPESWFLLVGDGPLRREVEAALVKEGIAERTVLPGLRRDASRMLRAMDVFLLTSLWEGLPRVIPEALAMGVPVVAYRADGSVEAVRDGVSGYLCLPGDLEGMAGRCLSLLGDAKLREEMGAWGREWVKAEFDLNVMIKQIEELYEILLEEKEQE